MEQAACQYTRKADGQQGVRRVVEVSDASRCSVRCTVFTKLGEALALAHGQYVAMRGTLQVWQNQLSLNVFGSGLTTVGVAEGEELATRFRRAPWISTPLAPRW